MPVQTVVETTKGVVTEVRPDGTAVCVDREVEWMDALIQVAGQVLEVQWFGVSLLTLLLAVSSLRHALLLICKGFSVLLGRPGKSVGGMKLWILLAGMRPPLG